MLLIGLGHRARQGKNTAALEMFNACPIGLDVRMVAFADALKAEVNNAVRQAHGAEHLVEGFKEAGLMPDWVRAETWPDKQRTILQWWGTDYRRAKDPEHWVKQLDATLDRLQPDIAFVTDVRFPNEVEFIRRRGGYAVKIVRLGAPDVAVNEHPSEAALDGFNGWDEVLAAKTLPELRTKARDFLNRIAKVHGLS